MNTLLSYIEEILRASPRPLSTKEILESLEKINQSPRGDDPQITIQTILSNDIKNNQELSVFMMTEPGQFALKTQVLVIWKEEIEKLGYFHGIRTDVNIFLPRFFGIESEKLSPSPNSERIRFKWKKRDEAEKNFYSKQLVVYVIVKYQGKVVRFSRGKGSSLRDNLGGYSIGVGGHVEVRDEDIAISLQAKTFARACLRCVRREVLEETGIDINKNRKELKAIGLLNDDSVEQGLQHIALVLLLELSYPEVHEMEEAVKKPHFVPFQNLADDFNYYEYWSQLCIQAFWGQKLKIECQILPVANFELHHQSEIILIVGFIGSGKSAACKLLEDEFGYVNVRCSKIMAEIIGCGPMEVSGRRKLQDKGFKFIHSDDGHNKLAEGIIQFMSANPGKRYVLDGLRYLETYFALANKIKKPITIIYVDKLIGNLWKHYNENNIFLTMKPDFDDYLRTIYHPVEKRIQDFRPKANIVIHNNGLLKKYISALREFFKKEIGS
jgi:predicted NUDIX family phosphoesterase